MMFFISTFLTLPVIGLYFSLRCRGFIAAFLWSLGVGLLVPVIGGGMLGLIWAVSSPDYEPGDLLISVRTVFAQLTIAALCWRGMRVRLRRRRFPLERTGQ